MKNKLFLLVAFVSQICFLEAQSEEPIDIVSVHVVSSGSSESEAITSGLRNALTQASSVFISSNTSVINDELARDEITMVNSGSISDYRIVDRYTNADELHFVSLDVNVSVNKLTNFVKNSGGQTELAGGLFAQNIKLLELNKRAEEKAVDDLIYVCAEILKGCFDYRVSSKQPVKNNKTGKWDVSLEVKVVKNSNYLNFVNFFTKTLIGLSMEWSDVKNLIELNENVYCLGLFDNSKVESVYPHFSYLLSYGEKGGLLSHFKNSNSVFYYQPSTSTYFEKIGGYNEVLKIQKSMVGNNTDRIPSGELNVLVLNDSAQNNYILLRSPNSFNKLKDFVNYLVYNFSKVKLTNGIQEVYINNLIDHNLDPYRPGYVEGNNHFVLTGRSYSFPIAFGRDQYSSIRFEFLKDDFRYFYLSNIDYYYGLSTSSPYKNFIDEKFMSYNHIRNVEWERKCYFVQRDEKGMRYFKKDLTSFIPQSSMERSPIEEFYFDLLFPNYFLYDNFIQFVRSKYPKVKNEYGDLENSSDIISLPIQLSLVGNENGVVGIYWITNSLSVDELSNVKSFEVMPVEVN